LAYFLNPKGTHGQGDVFLKAFIEKFYKEDCLYDNVCIKTEEPITNNRRIDVFIRLNVIIYQLHFGDEIMPVKCIT
ncbi:MAG TPA: PD-(D/E)XK nuclease family protein, partial [Salinivirga sp.]|uniref:PD-(D/E)XK nuclease family protein n=1 Tax=Salinivirga sp. TaxID=1970192 RepID=UPI002B46DB10